MTFSEKIKRIEEIRREESVSKRIEMNKNVLFELSNVVSDSSIASDYFSLIVSEYLSNANFEQFNKVQFDNEIHYVADSDIEISLVYGDNLQVNTLSFSYDNDNKKISIKRKGDSICVTKEDNSVENTKIVEKRVYIKSVKDGKYFNKSFYKKVFKTNPKDNTETIVGRRYSYNRFNNSLVKDVMSISKEDGNIISNTKSSILIDDNNYVIEDGQIFIVENNKLEKKVLAMQNDVIEALKVL